jgi:hypothetical protein
MFLVLAFAAVAPFVYDGTLHPGQTLTIRDLNGAIRVRAGDRLSIHATKTAHRSNPNDVAIKVETTGSGTSVCVRYPRDADRSCAERGSWGDEDNRNDTVVDFDVTVPHGAGVDAQTVNGTVDVVSDGPADVAAVNGRVRVEGRDVRSARTVNGSVIVRILDRGAGTLTAKTVNGSIDVSLPSGSGVDLEARTVMGAIHAEGVDVIRRRWTYGARANATLGDGSRHLSLATVNGSITLRR